MRKGFGFFQETADPGEWAGHIPTTFSQVVRIEVPWEQLEPQDGVIDWSAVHRYDDRVNAAIFRGAWPIILFGYPCPRWARAWDHPTAPPANPARYGLILRTLAARWVNIHGFEIWNEPNNVKPWGRFWGGATPNSKTYAQMLTAAFNNIKAVSTSRVILGGPAPYQPDPFNDSQWIKQVITNWGGKCDAVAIHPYFDVPSCLKRVRAVTGKKLLATEFGYTTYTGPGGATEAQQAEWLTLQLGQLRDSGVVTDATIYVLRDPLAADVSEGRFGLVRRDGSCKPGYYSLRNFRT